MIYICLFYFIIIFLDLDDNLHGNELLQQHKKQLTELQIIPSLGEKWPQKGEKSNHNEIYFNTVINTFFLLYD
jgi:hypothetical protein